MRPLLLVPCTNLKRLAAHPDLQGRSLAALAPSERVAAWRYRVANSSPRVEVADLYKGGGWSIVQRISSVLRENGGEIGVVSAGLGFAKFSETAPGYDLTFTRGLPDSIPDCRTGQDRADWWSGCGGHEKLLSYEEHVHPQIVVAALPPAYIDAVAPTLGTLAAHLGSERVLVLASGASRFARAHVGASLIEVDARQVVACGGTVGQITLSALQHVLERSVATGRLDRHAVEQHLQELPVQSGPVYPVRDRLGREHLRIWLTSALASGAPPQSASEALRRYRNEGFAFEQKAFHREFAEMVQA
jgi:hypothetical protein